MTERSDKLNNARIRGNDEFYTLYDDVNLVCNKFAKCFKNKVIYCNCDNPRKSNFVKYFLSNFNKLELKALITSDIETKKAFYISEVKPNKSLSELMKLPKNKVVNLKSGSFSSPECQSIMRECDIVVTNPPFSLFRDFFAQLMTYNVKFLIIAPMIATTYSKIFHYFKHKQATIVCENYSSKFMTPSGQTKSVNTVWITNLPNRKSKVLTLNPQVHYSAAKYPKYDDFNAIEVKSLSTIPSDYKGVMGVPITIMTYYLQSNFEIIGEKVAKPTLKGKELFNRVLIKL